MPPPFNEQLGIRIVDAGPSASLLQLTIEERHLNPHGVAHGAVLFALADTAMGAALYTVLDATESCATIEIKINYFRPVVPGDVQCRSQLIHRGKTTATLESTLSVGNSLVAKAIGTFAIFPRREPGAAKA